MPGSATITRVALRNYKSIRECDVSLGPVTFLVGPNGTGKSNFVEALGFLSDALTVSLEHAAVARSGFRTIVYGQEPSAATISFEIEMGLTEGATGKYFVEIGAAGDEPVSAIREACAVTSPQGGDWFEVHDQKVASNQGAMPAASEGKLYLASVSGLAAFSAVHRALAAVVTYNPIPDEMRGFKLQKRLRYLDRTGSALAETIFTLKTLSRQRWQRVKDYVRSINPNVLDVKAVSIDGSYNLRFTLNCGSRLREDFSTQNMSDGTLRALAVLVALFQTPVLRRPTVIGLEEPEAGLHPAAAGVLYDAITEAAEFVQVVVTTHSPDLLDRKDVPEEAIRAVAMLDGQTIIGRVDDAGRTALRERLYTAGELMRMDQLRPEGAPDSVDAR